MRGFAVALVVTLTASFVLADPSLQDLQRQLEELRHMRMFGKSVGVALAPKIA